MCEYIILEIYKRTSLSMMKTMGFGMNSKGNILFPALPYQPKKKQLSAFEGRGTCDI